MKVIAVANQKGGIGKTTTVTTIAAILKERGFKTLVIDADVQGNSTDTFRAEYEGVATLYDVILNDTNPVSINDAIQHTDMGDIIAADPLLCEAEPRLSGKGFKGLTALKNAMESLVGYDFVIIDTHPSIDMLFRNVLMASDEVVLPMKVGRYSFMGSNDLIDAVNDTMNMNPNLKIAGILRVDYDNRTNIAKGTDACLDVISKQLNTRVFASLIRKDTKVPESQSARTTLIHYAKSCRAQRDYEDFVEEYLGV